LKLQAKSESGPSYLRFKSIHPGAVNTGFIGSNCTAVPRHAAHCADRYRSIFARLLLLGGIGSTTAKSSAVRRLVVQLALCALRSVARPVYTCPGLLDTTTAKSCRLLGAAPQVEIDSKTGKQFITF